MPRRPAKSLVLAAITLLAAGHAAAQKSFQYLVTMGDLSARATDAAGARIVGEYSWSSWYAGVIWKRTGSFVDFQYVGGQLSYCKLHSITGDGTQGVGVDAAGQPARWNFDTFARLPMEGGTSGAAYAISASGAVVAGALNDKATVWDLTGHALTIVPTTRSVAWAVSDAGARVVGSMMVGSRREAFMWTAAGGLQTLPSWSNANTSTRAVAISVDGLTIVGYSGDFATGYLTRWRIDPATGGVTVQRLTTEPAYDDISGRVYAAVSADGSVIGGSGSEGPLVWSQAKGAVPLRKWLGNAQGMSDYGIPITLTDMSDDGRVLIGEGAVWSFSWNPDGGGGSVSKVGWIATAIPLQATPPTSDDDVR